MADSEAKAAEAVYLIEQAHAEIARLCSSPNERWRMSIPADLKRDSDLIISSALTAAEHLIRQCLNVNPDLVTIERGNVPEWMEVVHAHEYSWGSEFHNDAGEDVGNDSSDQDFYRLIPDSGEGS